jgi:hypothetical protein
MQRGWMDGVFSDLSSESSRKNKKEESSMMGKYRELEREEKSCFGS